MAEGIEQFPDRRNGLSQSPAVLLRHMQRHFQYLESPYEYPGPFRQGIVIMDMREKFLLDIND
jgi:hypothetical protein